jgi:EamA domain-containing membrane protein RarD
MHLQVVLSLQQCCHLIVIARIIYKEKLKSFQIIAIIIEFLGVLILTLMQGIFSVNKGLIW